MRGFFFKLLLYMWLFKKCDGLKNTRRKNKLNRGDLYFRFLVKSRPNFLEVNLQWVKTLLY